MRRPSPPQYRSCGPPPAFAEDTTGIAWLGWSGEPQAAPPVAVTSLFWVGVSVCMTTRLCTKPLDSDRPMSDPAGPSELSEKNQAICDGLSLIAETPSPPARSAQVDWSE